MEVCISERVGVAIWEKVPWGEDQRCPVLKTLSVSHEYNGLHMTWIAPVAEITGIIRSERLIIYMASVISCWCRLALL